MINLAIKVIGIALKWIIIGRTEAGPVYPLWGAYLPPLVSDVAAVALAHRLQVPAMLADDALVLRGLGAKIGRDTMIGELEVGAVDLVDHRRQCLDRPEEQVRQHRGHRRQGLCRPHQDSAMA